MENTTSNKLISKMYNQKKFFKMVYGTELVSGGNFKDNQHIRVYQSRDDYNKVEFFNNIDDLVKYVSGKSIHKNNTYFTLSSTNGESGQKQDLINRTVIGFDFDKKELGENFTFKDLIDKFKSIGLWYHSLVDSGHGYHAYICIEPTKDIDKVIEVTKAIGMQLGADNNAMKSTQILRVPYTFNIKDKPLQVSIISMFDINSIKRYNVNALYKRYCVNEKDKDTGNRLTNFTLSSTNIPSCIEDILIQGSQVGSRNNDLQKIVVTLRARKKSLNEIKAIVREWSIKSSYKENVEYKTEHIYNNLKYINMDCRDCKHNKECFYGVESNFDYPDKFNTLNMTETHLARLKANDRIGAKIMESNDLLVYSILKNHSEGLYRAEIIEDMTYTKKKVVENIVLSDKVLGEALQSLEHNGFIEVTGFPKFYKLKNIRSKIELTFDISYAATYECIKGRISTDELKLYNYMRYLHNKQQREDIKALKGNLFQFNQVDLAKDIGVTQGRISQMINNLLDEKLLSIWYKQPSKNNQFVFNVYRLNY